MMRAIVRSLACVTLLVAGACADEQPDPTGDLERPSGLVLVSRADDVAEGTGTRTFREDLLIVDSEAQGVRVQQFAVPEDLEDPLTAPRAEFVLGPSVFFPLVIPAEGFPTEIAAVAASDRAYVVAADAPRRVPHQDSDLAGKPDLLGKRDPTAPTEARLYVLDVPKIDVPGRATADGNQTLGFVALDEYGAGVPMDVSAWSTGADAPDRVVVLFDALGAPGRAIGLDLAADAALRAYPTTEDAVAAPAPTFDVQVGEAPRSLVVLPSSTSATSRTALVAYAGGAGGVDQIVIDDAGTATVAAIAGVGPTARLLVLDGRRALALRADEAAVIVLEADDAGVFARSSRVFESPFASADARGAGAAPGRIDLPQPVTSGALGTPAGFPLVDNASTEGVVLLTLLDGRAFFLRGDTLELVENTPGEAAAIRPAFADDASAFVRECGQDTIAWCVDADTPPDACVGLVQAAPAADTTYRATYRGALLSTRDFAVFSLIPTPTSVLMPIEVDFDLSRHLLAVGDEVQLQGAFGVSKTETIMNANGQTEEVTVELLPAAWRLTGRVITASPSLEIELDIADPNQIEGLERTNLFGAVLEVFPSGDEVVLAELDDGRIAEVHARAPVLSGLDGPAARLDVRPDGSPTPVALTLVATSSAGFTRTMADHSTRPCLLDSDCGPGRRCQETPASPDQTCPSRCSSCQQGEEFGCNPAEVVWAGSGVEVLVSAALAENIDLGDRRLRADLASTEIVNAVPYETAWMPVWGQWVISFPGSRTLLRVATNAETYEVGVTR